MPPMLSRPSWFRNRGHERRRRPSPAWAKPVAVFTNRPARGAGTPGFFVVVEERCFKNHLADGSAVHRSFDHGPNVL